MTASPRMPRRLRRTLVAAIISGAYSSSRDQSQREPQPLSHPAPPMFDRGAPFSHIPAESTSGASEDLLLNDPELAAGLLGQCDTSFLSRLQWTLGAEQSLTEQGFGVTGGSLQFAPIGELSSWY